MENQTGRDVSIKRLPCGDVQVIVHSHYHNNKIVLTEEQAREEGLI